MKDPLLIKQPCEVCDEPNQLLTCDRCAATICNNDTCRQVFDITERIRVYHCMDCIKKVYDKFEDYYSSDSDWEDVDDNTNCEKVK